MSCFSVAPPHPFKPRQFVNWLKVRLDRSFEETIPLAWRKYRPPAGVDKAVDDLDFHENAVAERLAIHTFQDWKKSRRTEPFEEKHEFLDYYFSCLPPSEQEIFIKEAREAIMEKRNPKKTGEDDN